jgi:hypothetical protein
MKKIRGTENMRAINIANDIQIRLPALVIPTRTLTVPHLTGDVIRRALDPSKFIIEAYFEDLLENPKLVQKCPFDIKNLANWQGYRVFLATRKYSETSFVPIPDFVASLKKEKSIKENVNENNKKALSEQDLFVLCENKTGRIKITLKEIFDIQARFKPDALICPSSFDVNYGKDLNEKAHLKYTENTRIIYNYLSQNVNIPISFPHVLGPSNIPTSSSILTIDDSTYSNTNYTGDDHPIVYLRSKFKGKENWSSFKESLANKSIDLFDVGIAVDLAEEGQAVMPDGSLLNLLDPIFKSDSSLLVESCQCVSCTEEEMGFMKGAIHHYLVVEEMLAQILLTCHNLHTISLLLHSYR